MDALTMKKAAGEFAARYVEPHMLIGIGTGSTAYWFIQALGERVKQGLQIRAVATSKESAQLASALQIPILELNDVDEIVLTVDGADEVDPQLRLIKGGGGALLQEKMVAAASRRLVIVADERKQVQQLGAFPLPVEVIPAGWKHVRRRILEMNCSRVELRGNPQPFVTDHGHYILDCYFGKIEDAHALNISLHQIPGVVETGLFLNLATEAIIARADGSIQIIRRES
ncbi:ribose-5-phosphate isomerase RpiA [Thermoflavifilum thermophilum]|uniref:Ribose-5-phosphate isomerase A n=1 Tax=Thermoflavifilum thermophilum TaxID=1393122 RepID=A0A1I7N993_9BACT|nr:ribose-5-phosphate isomerase RpiA [Thermoflavifilum thermophilum]SFV31211.1 ribose-5-phosphate isomerase [Thermoflavifilum thermophilum]